MKKIDRAGERRNNINGFEMEIIEYKNNKAVKVLFTEFGIVRNTSYRKFVSGRVYPTWRNKGYESMKKCNDLDFVFKDDEEIEFKDETGKATITTMGFVVILLSLLSVFGLGYALSALF